MIKRLKSLGPLAQAILMVMEDKYYTKLTSALNTSLQMMPMASEIIYSLSSPGSFSGVLRNWGIYYLLQQPNQHKRFTYTPFC